MTVDTTPAASDLLTGLPERQGFGDATLVRQGPGVIDLGAGNPDLDALPTQLHRDAAATLYDHEGALQMLHYAPSEGIAPLREYVARDAGVDPARVIISTGGANGLGLATLGTLDPGDTVVVDSPVYPLFLRTLDLVPTTFEPVPVQADGIDVEVLADKLRAGLRPKALYTVPTFHNPTGVTLSTEKEQRLVELAEHYGFTIIDDDPYRDLAFSGVRTPARRALLDSEHNIEVGSWSKTLGTGLRLGWLIVPTAHAHGYAKLRNRIDGQTSGVLQQLALKIFADERYPDAISAAGVHYGRKAEVLKQALREQFGERVSWVDPQGGFFLWATLAGEFDGVALFDEAQRRGVTYQRGEWFGVHPDDAAPLATSMRLGFASCSVDDLRLGAERLGEAWRAIGGK